MKILITIADISLEAQLNETNTARAIAAALPINGEAQRWGKEIYFEIPVDVGQAPDAREEVAVADLAYWPPGKAFCIFFGPTPASTDDKPRAASPVNVFGHITGNPSGLDEIQDGTPVSIASVD
jgi:hypothetical protein